SALGECDVVVKGTLAGEQRGWVRTLTGTFQIDQNGVLADPDATLRAQALTPGQERTYTAVPPGSGTRIGVDRDEDRYYAHTETPAGSDPEDPGSVPPGGSTTTTTTTTMPGSTTTTLPFVLIETRALKLTDFTGSSPRRVSFVSRTRRDPVANRFFPP